MDPERTLLSCPGRVQDWLGAAADQIESLLRVPVPSLSGSDQAIGALRIKLERPSWATGPYSSCPLDLVSSVSSVTYQVPPSVSFDRPLCEEKSPSRCENCVAEKGSRCSRDLPSCTRCHKKELLCFYVEDVPTGRRKPQGSVARTRSRIREGEPGLPLESPLAVSASEDPAMLELREELATLYHHPDTHPPHTVSEWAQSSLEKHPAISPVGFPMGISSAKDLTSSQYQTVVMKRQVTMLSATPVPGALPRRSKLETAHGISSVELQSQWPDVVTDGSNPSLVRGIDLAAAVKSPCQDPGSDEEQKTLENVLQKSTNEIKKHAVHLATPSLRSQTSFCGTTSVVSSLATTPFASTLASRSTSRSSGTDSLPITPANELPTPHNRTDALGAGSANIWASQVTPVSRGTSFASPKVSATDNTETCSLHVEQLADLYLLSHHRHKTVPHPTPGIDPHDKSFSDRLIEELFEEGDVAKGLAELQRHSPKKRKISLKP